MEGQQLQGDDAEDALQAVHAVRHIDGAARVLDGLVVVLVTDDNGPALNRQTAHGGVNNGAQRSEESREREKEKEKEKEREKERERYLSMWQNGEMDTDLE